MKPPPVRSSSLVLHVPGPRSFPVPDKVLSHLDRNRPHVSCMCLPSHLSVTDPCPVVPSWGSHHPVEVGRCRVLSLVSPEENPGLARSSGVTQVVDGCRHLGSTLVPKRERVTSTHKTGTYLLKTWYRKILRTVVPLPGSRESNGPRSETT